MTMGRPRHRRHSTVSFASQPTTIDPYRRPSSIHVKFKRKGGFTAGISLGEAQDHVRLSGNDSYRMHDLHADGRNRILLKVRVSVVVQLAELFLIENAQWAGYASMTYEIPLDGYDGRVSLQTLARRVSRACVHYLQVSLHLVCGMLLCLSLSLPSQANVIPIVWHRVQLHHLEEVAYGVWQPMLSVR
jgi:hypothetical protein